MKEEIDVWDNSMCRSKTFRGELQGTTEDANYKYYIYSLLCYTDDGQLERVGSYILKYKI